MTGGQLQALLFTQAIKFEASIACIHILHTFLNEFSLILKEGLLQTVFEFNLKQRIIS